MIKKIIVPLDFSDCSLGALKTAIEIAKNQKAEVILAHWYSRPYKLSMSTSGSQSTAKVDNKLDEKYKKEIVSMMDDFLTKINTEGVTTSKYLVFEKEITDMMQIKIFSEVDLIVIGTKGASGLKEIFIGSVAQKIIRYAQCPVLVTKEYVDYVNLENIVFVSDFEEEKTASFFKKLEPILNVSKAEIHLLKVITPSEFENSEISENKIDSFIQQTGITNYTKYIGNNLSIEKGIIAYSNKHNNSMVCITTRGLSGISSFMGSLSEDLVNGMNKPILSINMNESAK